MNENTFLFLTIHPKSVYANFRNDTTGERRTGSEPHDGSVFGASDACDRLNKAFQPEFVEISFNVK